MPIYEYTCEKCEHSLDALQKIADEPLVDCPSCGAAALKRMVSAPRFRLKGQGWYETDFKKDNQRNIAGEKEPSKPSADKADSKKTDAKSNDAKPKKESTTTSSDSKKSTAE